MPIDMICYFYEVKLDNASFLNLPNKKGMFTILTIESDILVCTGDEVEDVSLF